MVDASLRANILETLRNLQRDHGVSIIYITHDLTTAYHIAKSIIVLYRGSVMEAGDVDAVIKDPQHPYTKLLVDSIPWPNLDQRWGEHPIKARESPTARAAAARSARAARWPWTSARRAHRSSRSTRTIPQHAISRQAAAGGRRAPLRTAARLTSATLISLAAGRGPGAAPPMDFDRCSKLLNSSIRRPPRCGSSPSRRASISPSAACPSTASWQARRRGTTHRCSACRTVTPKAASSSR